MSRKYKKEAKVGGKNYSLVSDHSQGRIQGGGGGVVGVATPPFALTS